MIELPDVRITDTAVYMDGERVPGVIEQGGVSVQPGGGCNTVTVRFLVGHVDIEGGRDG